MKKGPEALPFQRGTTPPPLATPPYAVCAIGASPEDTETWFSFTSMNSLFDARLLRFFGVSSPSGLAAEDVGIFRVPPTDTAMAGTVPVPVASMIAGSACSSSHRIVSPSDLCPSSRVSWKILAAHVAGIRILRPRPSTFVCRSFDGRFATVRGIGITFIGRDTSTPCSTSMASSFICSACDGDRQGDDDSVGSTIGGDSFSEVSSPSWKITVLCSGRKNTQELESLGKLTVFEAF
ncbi:hypothetical protein ACSQ67_014044 [Phaseolus vulgaris]